MSTTIPLTQGKVAIVDDADYPLLCNYNWHSSHGYAATYMDGNRKPVRMHCYLLGCPEGMQVDHINRDTLDNRRCNLRVATNQQNSFNSGKKSSGITSRYKGVSFYMGRYQMRLMKDGKIVAASRHHTEEAAALAYDAAARTHFGEFAYLNFPPDFDPSAVVAAEQAAEAARLAAKSSRFRGVYRHRRSWAAELQVNGVRVFRRCYASEEEAARAYDRAALEHLGEGAALNFPTGTVPP